METIEVEWRPSRGRWDGVSTHKAQHFCLVVHPWLLILESPVLQLHRTCCRRSQPGFIGNAAAATGARPARCTPTTTGEFDWSAGKLGRAHAVAFGCSVGRDLHSVVARGTTRTVNVASDERSRCLESKPESPARFGVLLV
ncbi:hypothetical protein PC118_g22180 [Phytophthora cactorum]|uniref:Uncharacterized protein n=1 Tax=Phytophthora cactorum TaxID=29920 RepID=A0A8T1EYV0_9STRA|nr:hypothetical protein PC114_g22556 [Phytophthora cactorum]KAG2882781.1 hypothetical protein PC115_g21855 [Phytophthora cactorum]KAG2961031.1 hypothetical protein PC118_g22180 [Phytophthora cactorum]KAG2968933.1 hypothetical protein PC119_g24088 [Phytophthora cactorum]KAG3058772.1 hypothetical protein PC122_g20580 [Phytophthora cactorum]